MNLLLTFIVIAQTPEGNFAENEIRPTRGDIEEVCLFGTLPIVPHTSAFYYVHIRDVPDNQPLDNVKKVLFQPSFLLSPLTEEIVNYRDWVLDIDGVHTPFPAEWLTALETVGHVEISMPEVFLNVWNLVYNRSLTPEDFAL
jgi:hypothetical protein